MDTKEAAFFVWVAPACTDQTELSVIGAGRAGGFNSRVLRFRVLGFRSLGFGGFGFRGLGFGGLGFRRLGCACPF